MSVDEGKRGNTITWDIVDPRYEFAQNGIVFPENSGFTCGAENKQKFSCKNTSAPGVYKYTINVAGFDPVDPWVVNN